MKRNPLVLAVIMLFSVFACQDAIEEPSPVADDTEVVLKSAEIAENDLVADAVFEEANFEFGIFAQYEKVLRRMANYKGSKNLKPGNMGNRYKNDSSITVDLDIAEGGYPLTITIDYGDETTLKNGRVISGVVSIEISAPRRTDGAIRTTTYHECMFDSVLFDGTYVQEFNTGDDSSIVVSSNSDVTFTLPDNTQLHRVGFHTRQWEPLVAGSEEGFEHRIITINGETVVERSDETTWKREIIDPIIKLTDCRYPVQGVVQFSMNESEVAELDYGTGVCDDKAVLTINDEVIEIELQGKKPKADTEKYRNKKNSKNQPGNNGGGN